MYQWDEIYFGILESCYENSLYKRNHYKDKLTPLVLHLAIYWNSRLAHFKILFPQYLFWETDSFDNLFSTIIYVWVRLLQNTQESFSICSFQKISMPTLCKCHFYKDILNKCYAKFKNRVIKRKLYIWQKILVSCLMSVSY